MWLNYNGPLGPTTVGGSGSTQVTSAGIGTAGTTPQWAGGTQDSVWLGATGDGGSTTADYRAYSPAPGTGYTAASGVFAAGTGTSPDARNNTHSYYAGFGRASAPAAQLALFPKPEEEIEITVSTTRDDTSHLLSSEANRRHLEAAIADVKAGRNLMEVPLEKLQALE